MPDKAAEYWRLHIEKNPYFNRERECMSFCGFKPPTHSCVSVVTNERVPFHHSLLQANGEDDEKEHASYVDEGG